MEEDIKILEELRKELGLYANGEKIKQGQALENLIKGYRELDNEHENLLIDVYALFIPKSKITKKISELVVEEETGYFDNSRIIRILQELMEDK